MQFWNNRNSAYLAADHKGRVAWPYSCGHIGGMKRVPD